MSWHSVRPNRELNQNGIFLGLSWGDLAGVALAVALAVQFLEPFGKGGYGFFLLLFLPFLIRLRLKSRRKWIRDCIRFFFLPKVLWDPKRLSPSNRRFSR